VERLEKNREERKIRNAESREEKKTLMKKDPGNVNWEFSAMIKYIFCFILLLINLICLHFLENFVLHWITILFVILIFLIEETLIHRSLFVFENDQ